MKMPWLAHFAALTAASYSAVTCMAKKCMMCWGGQTAVSSKRLIDWSTVSQKTLRVL
jgi:hypothetical protein